MFGGRYGKIKGFDFYIQDRERLKPFQRRILLDKSEVYINEIKNMIYPNDNSFESTMNGPDYLDPDHHDTELMEHWNDIYDRYGYLINDFKSKWEREFIGNQTQFGNIEDESKPLNIDFLNKSNNKYKLLSMG